MMLCFFVYMEYENPADVRQWHAGRGAKPQRRKVTGWCDLPDHQWPAGSECSRRVTINGVNKMLVNLLMLDGRRRVTDWPGDIPDWWNDPLSVAIKFAELKETLRQADRSY